LLVAGVVGVREGMDGVLESFLLLTSESELQRRSTLEVLQHTHRCCPAGSARVVKMSGQLADSERNVRACEQQIEKRADHGAIGFTLHEGHLLRREVFWDVEDARLGRSRRRVAAGHSVLLQELGDRRFLRERESACLVVTVDGNGQKPVHLTTVCHLVPSLELGLDALDGGGRASDGQVVDEDADRRDDDTARRRR
jgi:hypothetical protein